MPDTYQLRPATAADAKEIAKLIIISSDGVALIDWTEQAAKEGCEPLEIGTRRYRQTEGNYSWRNATVSPAASECFSPTASATVRKADLAGWRKAVARARFRP